MIRLVDLERVPREPHPSENAGSSPNDRSSTVPEILRDKLKVHFLLFFNHHVPGSGSGSAVQY